VNSEETRTIVERIDAGVEAVLDRIRINTWIFGSTGILVIVLAVAVLFTMVRQGRAVSLGVSNRALAMKANVLAAQANKTALENKARQEVMNKQFTDFINQSIDVWNKLQKDNSSPEDVKRRGVKVPVAPTLRPPGLPEPNDRDLDRITRTVVITPSPTPKAKGRSHKYRRPSPTPTPGLFQRLFNPRSTR